MNVFDKLFSFGEAAEIWGLTDSALRKAVADGRLVEGRDCKKFGKQWVVSYDGMTRVFCSAVNSKSGEHANRAREYFRNLHNAGG